MNKHLRFLVAISIPLLILLLMAAKPLLTINYGKEVVLETNAFDPTDLFRGDYVAINLKITNVPQSKFSVPITQIADKTVYVLLKEEGNIFNVDTVQIKKPSKGIYLKGKIDYYEPSTNEAHINYALDRYFLPQGTGKELQDASLKGALLAKVKIWDGYGVLTDIELSK